MAKLIGTAPNQVPTNGDLGDLAFQNKDSVKVKNLTVEEEFTSTGIDITGTVTADGLSLGDNETINVGASNDLQIYHDGSHSFINESGTGNLRILAQNFTVRNPADNESMIIATPDGGVFLYHDNAEKLATTSNGVDVTGTVTATAFSGAGVYTDQSVASSNNSNGYIRFANNLIIQWVRKSVVGTQTITLPQAMDHYYGAYTGSETSGSATLRIHSLSTTQVVVGNRDGDITGWVLVYGRKT